MSEEKKSFTIRETTITNYEVVDENGDGEPECDEFGNNLFETREEAEQVLCREEEIAKRVNKLRRYQVMVTFDKFEDVVAETEQEAKRIAQARIDELVEDLSATEVSAWGMAVGDMFYSTEGSIEETDTDDERAAWDDALTSEDYPLEKKDEEENDDDN